MPWSRPGREESRGPELGLARGPSQTQFIDVNELQFSSDLVDRIRGLSGEYDERAYLFVLAALEYSQQRRPVRGHIPGSELAWACRDFAIEQYGLLARSVLSYWGVTSTEDFGRIVFGLIEADLLIQHPTDKIEDFSAVFDFVTAFDESYPWAGVERSVGTAG